MQIKVETLPWFWTELELLGSGAYPPPARDHSSLHSEEESNRPEGRSRTTLVCLDGCASHTHL